jgi:hypothetical protein
MLYMLLMGFAPLIAAGLIVLLFPIVRVDDKDE